MATISELKEIESSAYTENVRLLAHHDLAGAGDGMQLIRYGDYLYVAHVGASPMALSILDVKDPENPRLLRQLPHPPNTHNHKVQIVGNTLIQNSEFIRYIAKSGDEEPVTGVNVYNIDDPTDPRLIAFYPVPGNGVHRTWFRDAPYAYISAYVPGVKTRGFQIVDLSEPSEPRMAGAWWLPGSMPDDPDPWVPLDPHHNHYQLHGVIPNKAGTRAYASCTDAGMAILDITDKASPKVLSRINWCPPYGGYSHTSLPLEGRGIVVEVCETVGGGREANGDKRIWLIDVRDDHQPVIISSFPEPKPPRSAPISSFFDLNGRFGPHNCHENYANGFVSETLIFSTWFNGGLRVTDISNQDRPEEVGYFVPPPVPGQDATQINDVYVDKDKLVYITDRIKGGIYILEYTGDLT